MVVAVIERADTPVIAVPKAIVLRSPKRCMIQGARGTTMRFTNTIGPEVAIAAWSGEYPLTSCKEIVARNIAPDIAINAKVKVRAAALSCGLFISDNSNIGDFVWFSHQKKSMPARMAMVNPDKIGRLVQP
ncbi:unannotated protein [freshwater metagenome]|uniref:Unannotated protein n=1 Tax=freshwater metagenome TaxID=449393 RepID=A0A6J7GMQ6_9ZZZZ